MAAVAGRLSAQLRVLGPDHLTTRHNLAHWRGEAGDAAAAAVQFERLLADRLRVLGPDHPEQVQQLHTLIDRRHKAASTIYCTQLPPGQWHDRMEKKIHADAIIDRITTNAHATVLTCDDSMRKHFNQLT